MGRRIDLLGQRFGRLTVIEETSQRANGSILWKCRCDCGNTVLVRSNHLRRGGVLSCGCFNKEKGVTHGDTHTHLYATWRSLKDRCNNPNHPQYKDYGGRGIKVCDEWNGNYEAYREWSLLNGYADTKRGDCTIDRIDVNGNYEPSNCRWVDMKAQCRNRRNNVVIECDGESHCLSEWAEMLGEPYQKLVSRHRRGWKPHEILYGRERVIPTETYRNRKTNRLLTFRGETHCAVEWAEILGINANTIRGRVHRGWSDEQVLGTPI